MVITVLEAHVAPEKVGLLEEAYRQGIEQLDAGIEQTFLLRAAKETSAWQIVTVWQSRAALDEMRRTSSTPRGVVMFQAADAEPVLTVFEVIAHAVASA